MSFSVRKEVGIVALLGFLGLWPALARGDGPSSPAPPVPIAFPSNTIPGGNGPMLPTSVIPAPPRPEEVPADGSSGAPPVNPDASSPSPSTAGSPSPNPGADKSSASPSADKSSATKETTLTAGWKNGFYIQSTDKDFVMRITGQIQADYRYYMNNNDTTDFNTYLIRRARLGVEADMFKYYEFRLLPDFGQGTAVVQDAYMNIHYVDYLQVESGKFKQPFSFEQLIQDRFIPTIERSMIDQLVPARDIGVMLHGKNVWNQSFDYGVSVSNGEINGSGDTNGDKDLVWRVAVHPFRAYEEADFLRYIQFGMSGSIGKEEEPVNPQTLKTPFFVPFFQFNPTVRADGIRFRYSPEVVYFWQGFGFAAQYYKESEQLRPIATSRFLIDVPMDGFYVLGTWLLTGEERTEYSQAVEPLRNFDPCHPFSCPGAWELVARVSRLEVDTKVFRGGAVNLADATRFSRGATEMTLGFNWYLNKWFRTQVNWEHDWLNNPVLLGTGPGGKTKFQDSIFFRSQIIF
jgi:phosphate-selective porin OprO/OprP